MDYKNYFEKVTKFIMDAKNGLYYKQEYKLKWKSIVIRIIKNLTDQKKDDPYFNQGTDLFYKLFMLLEYSKNDKIFITNNTFKDINYDEVDLYKMIMRRYFVDYHDILTRQLFIDVIYLSIFNKRFVLWPITIYANEMEKLGKLEELFNLCKTIYKDYYKEFKKTNKYQLLIEYLLYNMVIIGNMLGNIKNTVNTYYSYSIIDKEDAFNALFDIASVYDNKQLFMYVYEDGLARRIKPTPEQIAEYDELKVVK